MTFEGIVFLLAIVVPILVYRLWMLWREVNPKNKGVVYINALENLLERAYKAREEWKALEASGSDIGELFKRQYADLLRAYSITAECSMIDANEDFAAYVDSKNKMNISNPV